MWWLAVAVAKLAAEPGSDPVARALEDKAAISLRVSPTGEIMGRAAPQALSSAGSTGGVSIAVDASGAIPDIGSVPFGAEASLVEAVAVAASQELARPNAATLGINGAGAGEAPPVVPYGPGGAESCEAIVESCLQRCESQVQNLMFDIEIKWQGLEMVVDVPDEQAEPLVRGLVAEGALVFCAVQMCYETTCGGIKCSSEPGAPVDTPGLSEARMMEECKKVEGRKTQALSTWLDGVPQLALGQVKIPQCYSVCGPRHGRVEMETKALATTLMLAAMLW